MCRRTWYEGEVDREISLRWGRGLGFLGGRREERREMKRESCTGDTVQYGLSCLLEAMRPVNVGCWLQRTTSGSGSGSGC